MLFLSGKKDLAKRNEATFTAPVNRTEILYHENYWQVVECLSYGQSQKDKHC